MGSAIYPSPLLIIQTRLYMTSFRQQRMLFRPAYWQQVMSANMKGWKSCSNDYHLNKCEGKKHPQQLWMRLRFFENRCPAVSVAVMFFLEAFWSKASPFWETWFFYNVKQFYGFQLTCLNCRAMHWTMPKKSKKTEVNQACLLCWCFFWRHSGQNISASFVQSYALNHFHPIL